MSSDPRRLLPAVDRLLARPDAAPLVDVHGRVRVTWALREALAAARFHLQSADAPPPTPEALVAEAGRRLEHAARPSLGRVVNATGVVVHTNLGRAPLSLAAARHVVDIASSYSNLEMDLASGERGDRETHAEARARDLLSVEASLVVNNNAAAVLLALNTLADGREVLVSRGELVEIGGSFRIPEILSKSGARLREVGTTNRTRLRDYESALSAETALILKVHPSNFRVMGFVESVSTAALVSLARRTGVALVEDQGSGLLAPTVECLGHEASATDAIRAGADVVTFSGDKLLGGPQAGLAVGRADLIERMRRNPLYRALRVDKMTIAALDAVLAAHQRGTAHAEVPVLRMLAASREELSSRAESLARRLRDAGGDVTATVIDASSAVGGGAAPLLDLPTVVVALTSKHLGATALAAALRASDPPIVARITDERVVLDLRTVAPDEEDLIAAAMERLQAAASTRATR